MIVFRFVNGVWMESYQMKTPTEEKLKSAMMADGLPINFNYEDLASGIICFNKNSPIKI